MQFVFNLDKETNSPGQELSPYVSMQCLTQQSYYLVEPSDSWTTPPLRLFGVKGKAEALNWFSLVHLFSSGFYLYPLHLTVLKIQANPAASYIRETMLLRNIIFWYLLGGFLWHTGLSVCLWRNVREDQENGKVIACDISVKKYPKREVCNVIWTTEFQNRKLPA